MIFELDFPVIIIKTLQKIKGKQRRTSTVIIQIFFGTEEKGHTKRSLKFIVFWHVFWIVLAKTLSTFQTFSDIFIFTRNVSFWCWVPWKERGSKTIFETQIQKKGLNCNRELFYLNDILHIFVSEGNFGRFFFLPEWSKLWIENFLSR